MTAERLLDLSAQLGSDVPFFLGAGPAVCRGRGERIKGADNVPSLPVVLLKPWFGVATPEAYRRFRDAKALPGIDYGPQTVGDLPLVNDLERPVFSKHLFLAEMKQWLRAREEVAAALMSGSGSTMYAVLRDGASPESLIAAAREELDPTLWIWTGRTEGEGAEGA
jgi:4-diphosphocytidyl-2-C-methyl-D-erythritol kinase